MTQGRKGISLAPGEGRRRMGIARLLSVVAAMFVIAALVAGTAGSSYAGKKKEAGGGHGGLLDTVVVSNNGALFNGSLETFPVGSGPLAHPQFLIHGTNTFLGASGGPIGDAVSSLDGHIAVAIPLDFLDLTASLGPPVGCGPFGQPAASPLFGTGLVEIFGDSSTGNSAPEVEICSPNFAVGAPNTTGIFFPQGVGFEDPFDQLHTGHEILAVANNFPEVDQDAAICAGSGLGTVTLGTITLYDRTTFHPGLNNSPPFVNNPVSAINPFTGAMYTQNASIGGCLTSLAGPVSVQFDQNGFLFVVNNAGLFAAALAATPRLVSVFQPDAALTTEAPFSRGDVFPVSLIGIAGTETGGDILQPVGEAVLTLGFEDDLLFVTDTGDNSIKIFDPFQNPDILIGFAFAGQLEGVIHGGSTKLKGPEGTALSPDGDTLYVTNSDNDTLSMFTDITDDMDGGDIAPTLIIKSNHSKMILPVGVAVLGQFTPTPTPAPSSTPTEGALGAE